MIFPQMSPFLGSSFLLPLSPCKLSIQQAPIYAKFVRTLVRREKQFPVFYPKSMRFKMAAYELSINGKIVRVEAEADMPLLWAVRDLVGLTGTKYGCGMSLCGACTILADGEAIRSCVTTVASIGKRQLTTIEGLNDKVGEAIKTAWQDLSVPQCGYCQSGQILAAKALLTQKPKPSDQDIDTAMSGNICRCGTYADIKRAIHKAADLVGRA